MKDFHASVEDLANLERETKIFNLVHGENASKIHSRRHVEMKKLSGIPLSEYGTSKLSRSQTDSLRAAVSAMHKKGVLHGDLNNGNILFDEKSGKFNLIDFGASSYPAKPEDLKDEMEELVWNINQWHASRRSTTPPSVVGADGRVFI
ncbi:protein kinase domain-containing protein [Burkholderia stagnalis]|uniref:OspG family effector kinase n=1 Tax=Burkholderia stagnalis TaxID=1503054 RepID=UPI0018C6A2EF|nr:lipopolysaccharide kinase InaA family protein [Burkholderia stagnalis]MDY7806066.1 lipopolysaccharide kinase InaA family protein [Burkholderia stagnalis]